MFILHGVSIPKYILADSGLWAFAFLAPHPLTEPCKSLIPHHTISELKKVTLWTTTHQIL